MGMTILAYQRDTESVIERLRLLVVERLQDRIFARFETPSRALQDYLREHPIGFCPYPDPVERVAFWDALLSERSAIEDDSLPCAYLSELDQGLYGGLVGGEVEFLRGDNGWVSSMTRPILRDWPELDRLIGEFLPMMKMAPWTGAEPDGRKNPWLRRYLHHLDALIEAARGKFGLSHFILIDGLNFAFELVGATQTYLALTERPDWARQAIAFAFDLNVAIQETFFARVPLLEGGTCSNMIQWAPGRVVSESVDPFHMTSVGYFERWGRQNIERMFARFDGGVLHIHGNGRHLLDAVSTIKGLRAILLGDDRGYPPAFGVLPELKRRTGDVPLAVSVDFAHFTSALDQHILPGGVFYHVTDAPDADTANRWMERVRGYEG